jgi:polyphosphate kinase
MSRGRRSARPTSSRACGCSTSGQRGDVLLYHPYQSFDPVLRLIEEAADDPDVLAIKQILYRTSRNSPMWRRWPARRARQVRHGDRRAEGALRRGPQHRMGPRLEETGVQVIYGVKGLKTHAKTCIIVRREPHGIVRYVHFGTGNYNEMTARIYSDASF